MTIYDTEWAVAEEARRTWMAENSLYKADDEHSSCGVGLVVSIDGTPSRGVVEKGIAALKAVWHRGPHIYWHLGRLYPSQTNT